MCGIVGSIGEQEGNFIKKSLSQLSRRGPDQSNQVQLVGNCTLAATRLCMVDNNQKSSQPFSIEDSHLVFNGEIYNHLYLRSQFLREVTFETMSDTETLARLLHRYGKECLPWLEGMYAIAYFKEKTQELYLIRDKLGKKPLYFFKNLQDEMITSIRFASLPACLEQDKKELKNPTVLYDFLHLGYLLDPESAFKQVVSVMPGEVIKFERGVNNSFIQSRSMIEKHTAIGTSINNCTNANSNSAKSLRTQIIEAVEVRLDSPYDSALSLSGGIDSTVIAIAMRELGKTATCFSVKWPDSDKPRYNFDHDHAKLIASKYGHEFVSVSSFEPKRLSEYLDKYLRIMQEPNGNPTGLSMIPLYEAMNSKGFRLALTGDGADEIFGGYARYKKINFLSTLQLLGTLLPKQIGSRKIPQNKGWPSWAYWHQTFDINDLMDLTKSNLAHANRLLDYQKIYSDYKASSKSSLDLMMRLDLNLWLTMESNRRLDRVSMHYSVEARSPFQDFRLQESLGKRSALSLRMNLGKKEILAAFPELYEIINYPKVGFVSPLGHWLRVNVNEVEQALSYIRERFLPSKYFDTFQTKDIFSGDFLTLRRIWHLLVLAKWGQLEEL